ncbi:MAG: ATP-binding protein [Bacteroides sp.]
MNRILHDATYSERILQIIADTLILVRQDGLCVDIDTHSNQWFLQEDHLLGENLFELIPQQTLQQILPVFQEVIYKQEQRTKNFQMQLKEVTYYFKCIMTPYNGMVLCQYRDITERSTIKLQLERANRELKEIQKAAQIGQWKYNTLENNFFYCGYTEIMCEEKTKEISLEQYSRLILPEDRHLFENWIKHNCSQDNESSIDYRICVGKQIYYIRLKAFVRERMPNGSYNVEGYIQNVTDIQRRRNDINTLTHAINNAKESIFAAKADGTLVFANRQFKSNHHLSETAEIETMKIYETVGDMQSLEAWERRYQQVSPNKNSNFIAYHPLKYDADTLAFEGVMYHVTNDEGEVSYWSFSHDISDRLRYESQIKRLNRIMDMAMRNLPASIVVKDINNDFRYIYRNRQLYDPTINVENAVGKNDFDYHPLKLATQKRKEDLEIARTGKEMHKVIENVDYNGNTRIVDKRKMRVDSKDFSPILISIEWDITQLELMKRELVKEKEKAETSDKLKSVFLANMSHEIRTPLNAIVGFSRIIAESEDKEERKSYYNIVEANNERLLTLINEILDLSKIESGIVEFTLAPVRLHRLCKEIHDAHVFRCPATVQLVFDDSDEKLIIDSDKNRVFQVISNLIGNSFKFTTKGSISYGYRQEGDQVVFHVTDTGMGIEQEKLKNVFERFMKMNNFAQGSGLGLSICRTIIERLGGKIWVTSEMGAGTTFRFSLPARQAGTDMNEPEEQDAQTEQTSRRSMAGNAGSTLKVNKEKEEITLLIAEDTDSNYALLDAILGKTYRLARAMDGIEAVNRFEEIKPDLVLMDIRMPNLNGLEATRIIRELSPEVPIFALSAYAYNQDIKAALEAGCNEFISKPIATEKLKDLIIEYLFD